VGVGDGLPLQGVGESAINIAILVVCKAIITEEGNMLSTQRMIVVAGIFALMMGTSGCMSDRSDTRAQSHDDAWCSVHPKQCDNKDWCAKHADQCTSSGGN
jgi:hypothetical protein